MTDFCKKNKFLIISFLLLIIYLINANNLIISLDKKNDKLSEITFDQFTSQNKVRFALAEPVLRDDMLKTMYISGWAFCENDLVRPEREISIILASDRHCYSVSNKATLRRDFYATFKEQIDNAMSGIETQFSTINIKDGIYRVYIYVQENGSHTGLAYTGLQFKKDHGTLKKIEGMEVDNIKDQVNQVQDLKYTLGIKSTDNNEILLDGWILRENENTENQLIYFEFVDTEGKLHTYEAISYLRNDVVDAYKNEKYLYSGFRLKISLAQIENEFVSYKVLLKMGNTYYTNGQQYSLNNKN